MKTFTKIICAMSLLWAAVACDKPEPEPIVPEVKLTSLGVRAQTTEATLAAVVANADQVAYIWAPTASIEHAWSAEDIFAEGMAVTNFNSNESYNKNVDITATLLDLTPGTAYTVGVAAKNSKGSTALTQEFTTLPIEEPEPEPEPDPEPTIPAVVMSEIDPFDVQGTTVEFSLTVSNMDLFGFKVVPTAELTEMSDEYIIENSDDYYWEDGNTSWEAPMTFAFHSDVMPLTEYTVVAVAANSISSERREATFTTPNEELMVEKMSLSATRAQLTSNGNDHYIVFSNALNELGLHLVSEGFGGRYEPSSESHYFVAEGSYFKSTSANGTVTTWDELDATFGCLDTYENIITGKWECYGSFFFLPNLALEMEIPIGIVIEGAERDTPTELPLNITSAEAKLNGNFWYLTLTQDKDNTVTLAIDLMRDLDHIPSGTYKVVAGSDPTVPHINTSKSSAILNNVATSLSGYAEGYVSEVTVEYDSTTGESYFSGKAYIKSRYAVATIAKCGPFKLYETEAEVCETVDEGRNLMIWALWNEAARCWQLEWAGDNFYGYLYFMTGASDSEQLPEGRYYLMSSKPGNSNLWIDCKRSYAQKLRTQEQLSLIADKGYYIDVTTSTNSDGEIVHDIVGSFATTNGAYIINFNYDGEQRGSIY